QPGIEEYHPDTVFSDSFNAGAFENHHDEIETEEEEPVTVEAEELTEGRVSHIVAVEVLCPSCNNPCADRESRTAITYELVGHTVVCSGCGKSCIVPLNAFNMLGEVIAREKPTGQASKREKKGRTKKERKSTRGRKAKSGVVREPCQLSLDVKTIQALNFMG